MCIDVYMYICICMCILPLHKKVPENLAFPSTKTGIHPMCTYVNMYKCMFSVHTYKYIGVYICWCIYMCVFVCAFLCLEKVCARTKMFPI